MKKNNVKRVIIWVVGGFFLILFCGMMVLSNMDPNGEYDGMHTPTTPRTVTIVLIDGLSKDIFNELINQDKLPHLRKLISKSTYIPNGIGSFPSMTGYAFYPFITGMDAPDSGIYGLRWFDRSLDYGNLRNYVGRTNIQMNNDISDDYKNIFELNRDYYTASINTYMNKGVHHSLKTGWAHTTAKFSKESVFMALRAIPLLGNNMSKDHFEHETLVTNLACKQLEKNPKVQWITYPSLDAHNHVHGTDDTYYHLMEHIDGEVGRIIQKVDELNQKDRMVVVVSDHGILDVDVNIDIPGILKDSLSLNIERGLSAHLDTDELTTPLEDFVEADGYFVINGNLSAYLYMKNPDKKGKEGWRSRTKGKDLKHYITPNKGIDLPAFLSRQEGIDLVAYKSGKNSIEVYCGNEAAKISLTVNGQLSYTPLIGDPLKMDGFLLSGKNYHQDSLLMLTTGSDYPYAVARLWSLLSREDAPDIVITTSEGYDLARDYEIFVDNYKGGHGGIHKSLLNVPYIIYCPEARPRIVSVARSEDVGATIIDYLGLEIPYSLSGNSLLSE